MSSLGILYSIAVSNYQYSLSLILYFNPQFVHKFTAKKQTHKYSHMHLTVYVCKMWKRGKDRDSESGQFKTVKSCVQLSTKVSYVYATPVFIATLRTMSCCCCQTISPVVAAAKPTKKNGFLFESMYVCYRRRTGNEWWIPKCWYMSKC